LNREREEQKSRRSEDEAKIEKVKEEIEIQKNEERISAKYQFPSMWSQAENEVNSYHESVSDVRISAEEEHQQSGGDS
jgi:hypothetical protein